MSVKPLHVACILRPHREVILLAGFICGIVLAHGSTCFCVNNLAIIVNPQIKQKSQNKELRAVTDFTELMFITVNSMVKINVRHVPEIWANVFN